VVQASLVQALDAVGGEQVSIGDHARDRTVLPHAADDLVEFRVEQGFAAADRDNGSSKLAELVDPLVKRLDGYRLADVVVLVAILARQITAAHRDDVRHDGMVG
jgi:hypothetical protein